MVSHDPTRPAAGEQATRFAAARAGKARVLVVEDHPIVRLGLCQLINAEPDLEACGEAAGAQEALERLEECSPDAAVVDVALNGRNGIELVKDLKARRRDLPVLVLSMYDESLYAERALRAGAMGYVMKEEAASQVLAALRRVLNGHVYLSDRLSSTMVRRVLDGTAAGGSPLEQLSDRELEVFQLIARGLPMREIARRLHRSVKTVETHREHLKAKLGLKSSGELLRYAVEHNVAALGGSARADEVPVAPPPVQVPTFLTADAARGQA
jgi:DNA-binding NarL/FixJ family response regulator